MIGSYILQRGSPFLDKMGTMTVALQGNTAGERRLPRAPAHTESHERASEAEGVAGLG